MCLYIEILNNGSNIVKTNFFNSEYAKNGNFFLSTNEDCVRLLVPGSEAKTVKGYCKDTEYIILSRGPWPKRNLEDGIEVLFEKHARQNPVIYVCAKDCDGLPGEPGVWLFTIWTRYGKQFECPLFVRNVSKIPCLLSLDYLKQPFVLPPVQD